MPKAALVKKGEEYLPGVQLSELEEMYRLERPGKSGDRLQAAVLRKQGRMLEKIARITGRGISTIHRRLSRMEREGPDGRHDGESPGRPRPPWLRAARPFPTHPTKPEAMPPSIAGSSMAATPTRTTEAPTDIKSAASFQADTTPHPITGIFLLEISWTVRKAISRMGGPDSPPPSANTGFPASTMVARIAFIAVTPSAPALTAATADLPMWWAILTKTGFVVADFTSLTTIPTNAGSSPNSPTDALGHDRFSSNPTTCLNSPTIRAKSSGSPARLTIVGKSGLPNMSANATAPGLASPTELRVPPDLVWMTVGSGLGGRGLDVSDFVTTAPAPAS